MGEGTVNIAMKNPLRRIVIGARVSDGVLLGKNVI